MFGVWGKPPEEDSRYTSLVHHRNWKREKSESSEARKRDRVFSIGSLVATEGALVTYLSGTDYWKKKGISGLAKDVVDPEAWYKKIRSAEQTIPFFNIPLKVTQLGDMLSPFVSSKEMAWTYGKSELFDERGEVKKDFMSIFLGEEMASTTSHEREVREKELKSLFERKDFKRVEFQKESGVWGKIVALDQDDKIIAEVTGDRALMERPTTLKAGLPSLFEPMRRQSTFLEPAKDSSWVMKGLRFLGGEKAEKHRNLVGFVQGWAGGYISEHFRAMNTFLKEPIPFFDSLFHLKEKKAESAKNIIDKTIAGSFGEMGKVLRNLVDLEGQQVEQITPLGRLYPWMRPYVSSPYWQASATRLTAALAAKGSIYTMGLPAAYNLIDWTRRKTGELPIGASALVGGASMAVIGAGIGSLIKSDYMAFSNKRIAELTKGAVPRITRTQFGGAAIGLGIGVLPGFDKGLTAGFASMYSNARIWSARVWDSLGATESVERQERLMPGITSPAIGFGVSFAGGVLGYVNQQMGTTRQLIGYDKHAQKRQAALDKFFESISRDEFTKAAADANVEDLLMKTLEEGGTVSDALKAKVSTRATVRSATTDLLLEFANIEQPGVISQIREAADILQHGAMDDAGKARPIRSGAGFIAGILHSWTKSNADSALALRLSTETGRREAASKVQILWTTIQETWARSRRAYEEELMSPLQKVWSRAKSALTSPSSSFTRGFARGAALFTGVSALGAVAAGPVGGNWNPINLIPGWMIKLTGGGTSARETEQIFTGEKEVAIRKARWWAIGSSPWEGSKVSYFRKHRAVVAQTDASDEALYGGFDQKIASDPILNPLRALVDPEFLYEREKRLEYVSPTPLSGRLFADVPILGDVMGATVGELLKPTRKIRASEWEGYREPGRFHDMRSAPAVEALGGDSEITGVSQTGVASVMRGTFKKLTEQAGLRGFMLSSLIGFKDRIYETPMVERADSLLSAGRAFWSMNLGDPVGLCIAEGQWVTTERGPVLIDDIKIGDSVLSLDGTWRAVKSKWERQSAPDELVRLSIGLLGETLTTTKGHRIYASKNGVDFADWSAEDLKPGDFVVSPFSKKRRDVQRIDLSSDELPHTSNWIYWNQSTIEFARAYEMAEAGASRADIRSMKVSDRISKSALFTLRHKKVKRWPRQIELTDDLLYLMGWWLAEGSATDGRVSFVMNKSEICFAEQISATALRELGVNSRICTKDNVCQVRFSHVPFASYLNKTLGKGARNKSIPTWIQELPRERLCHFLAGYLRGDGWKRGFTSSSGHLARQVQSLLLSMGIHCHALIDYMVRPRPGAYYPQGAERRPGLRSNIRTRQGSHEEQFQNLRERRIKEFEKRASEKSFFVCPIRKIEQLEKSSRVYDLEVEGLHYFVVSRVAVHNSEAARRYLTRDRNTYFNPLSNLGSEIPWLPKDDFYLDFSKGNYYNKVAEGELRLPGPGFETLHPELKGLHPANYPLAYRYKILAGTAYGSEEFKFAKQQLIEKMQRNELSDKELEIVAETNRQLEEKSERKPFGREKFSEDNATAKELTVSAVLEDGTFTTLEMGARAIEFGGVNISMAALVREQMKRGNISKIKEAEEKATVARQQIIQEIKSTLKPGSKVQVTLPQGESAQFQGAKTQAYIKGLSQKLVSLGGELDQEDVIAPKIEFNTAQKGIARAWEVFRMNADAPLTPGLLLSKILPFKPQEKFIQRLDAVDLYARTRVYGREIQMWQNYKRDFIDSFLNEQKAKVFGDEVPEELKFKRSLTEYFDKIQWLKNFVHEQAARRVGDGESVAYYENKKRQTLYGVDPYRGYEDIWRALPQTERDFYREFVGETDPDKQQRILDLVPENMKGILIAQWQNRDMQALRNKQDAGVATQAEKAELRKMQNLRRVEGFTWDESLDREYKSETRGTEISYSDWMRLKIIREYFQAWKMPDASFVGFDPRVDLEEVKYKVAQKEGIDVHDIGMWESAETGMGRKPYLDQAAEEIAGWKGEGMSYQDFELNLRKMIGHANAKIQLTPLPPGSRNRMIVRGKDTRESEVRSLLSSM